MLRIAAMHAVRHTLATSSPMKCRFVAKITFSISIETLATTARFTLD